MGCGAYLGVQATRARVSARLLTVCARVRATALVGLGFSVAVFEIFAVIGLAVFFIRRKMFGYELGGRGKWTHAAIFASFWALFIVLCSLNVTGVITFG